MKKLVRTGDPEVIKYLEDVFAKAAMQRKEIKYPWDIRKGYFDCPAGCGFICPAIMEEFEVVEEIEFPQGQNLELGIYRIVHHDGGNTSHYIQMQKWENGQWASSLRGHAGWAGDVMVDWRGILRATIQKELPL